MSSPKGHLKVCYLCLTDRQTYINCYNEVETCVTINKMAADNTTYLQECNLSVTRLPEM